jgi:hypothetical protein
MTFTAGGIFDVNAAGAVTIDSTAAAISIGSGADAYGVNIGTGAAVRDVIVGSTNTTSSTTIQSGSGNVIVTSTDDITVDGAGVIELNSTAGAISIGNDADAYGVNIGTGAADRDIVIGNSTAGSSVSITGGNNGDILLTPATNSAAATSITLNAKVGSATFTGQTTASGAQETFTITNSEVSATSAMMVTVTNVGANDARMSLEQVKMGAGSFEVMTQNNGAASLNGDVIINWIVMS